MLRPSIRGCTRRYRVGPKLIGRASAVFCAHAFLSASAFADYGDYFVPKTDDVPVFAGPDAAFKIRTHIDHSHVVMENGTKRIRGFAHIYVPKESHITGYVEVDKLEKIASTDQLLTPPNDARLTALSFSVPPTKGAKRSPPAQEDVEDTKLGLAFVLLLLLTGTSALVVLYLARGKALGALSVDIPDFLTTLRAHFKKLRDRVSRRTG